ncbi:acetoacetate--CoA ligase [Streptomyces sp. NPDC020490]|uniref:acetoacetate--CoA ligase n=1 Tax=Streptomyces sp. NPDC020490 TaxID=3365078 RepID=UPI00379CB2E4
MSSMSEAPALLWSPDPQRSASTNLSAFQSWAVARHNAPDGDYRAFHTWSVDQPRAFWSAVAEWFDVRFSAPPVQIMTPSMGVPGVEWFTSSRLNYAEHALRHGENEKHPDSPAILHFEEGTGSSLTVTWGELRKRVASLSAALRRLGIKPGDRVAGYMPNVPETVIALLATTAVGAIWSGCAPDFGVGSLLDRFRQIDPVALITVDGYRYGGKTHERTAVVNEIRQNLPSLRHVIHVPVLGTAPPEGALDWNDLVHIDCELEFEQVNFSHPLWILYTSGTTGPPKAIVHSHGGIVVEHLKQLSLQMDIGPEDRFFWYTSTGWMMWNFLVAGLLVGATIVTYDGSPGYPSIDAQWRIAELADATVFGTSAAYMTACRREAVNPGKDFSLSRLRTIGTTGSPLPPDAYRWLHSEFEDRIWLASISGGTDVCTSLVGGVPTLPVYLGQIQGPALGVAAEAWSPDGERVFDEVGELVVRTPMPSMPVSLWNDDDGRRYHDTYFDMYPGVWRHGDWITMQEDGSAVIHGRSDSTLNRQGVRLGSADIYEVVERFPAVTESLIVGLELESGDYWMPMFVVLDGDVELDASLTADIVRALRERLSPRHAPDEIIQVNALPHTLTGKRLEVPIKRILSGVPIEVAVNPGSVDNFAALQPFQRLAAERASHSRPQGGIERYGNQ